MGRYFIESDAPAKKPQQNDSEQVYNISQSSIKKVKLKNRHKKFKAKGIEYDKKKHRGKERGSADPFPGRKPVDPAKVEKHSRGQAVDVRAVKTLIKKKDLQRQEKNIELAAETAAR